MVVQQIIGVKSVKPGRPVGVKTEPGTGEPSMEFTSIFVGGIPMAVTDNQLQVMLGVKAKKIRRYHGKAKFDMQAFSYQMRISWIRF